MTESFDRGVPMAKPNGPTADGFVEWIAGFIFSWEVADDFFSEVPLPQPDPASISPNATQSA
jgi:hypothetical protein